MSPASPAAPRPGFRIVRDFDRPPGSLIEAVAAFPAALLSDVQGRVTTLHHRVKPISKNQTRVTGSALTVKSRPGDNLLSMKALELAQPGDVIVISCDHEANLSVWGGVMSTIAVRQGIAGVVADGLVRDVAQIRESGLPVFATGLTPAAPTKNGPGQINTTISCGGIVIHPGDIIVGDDDGVVVVPRTSAREIVDLAHARVDREKSWLDGISRGDYSALIDSDETLRAAGCVIVD